MVHAHPHTHTHTCTCVQIILSRKSEILSVDCEMSAVHGLLSKLPDSISYEQLITVAAALFEKHPPINVAKKGQLKMRNRSVFLLLSSSFPPSLPLSSFPPLPLHLPCLSLSNKFSCPNFSMSGQSVIPEEYNNTFVCVCMILHPDNSTTCMSCDQLSVTWLAHNVHSIT